MQTPKPVSVQSLLILLSVLLSACTFEQGAEETEGPMVTAERNNWGQSKKYGPNWQSGVPLTVTQLRQTVWPPQVLTATLAFEFLSTTAGRHDARWVWKVTAGVGGASRVWQVDARPLQQLALPAETLELSLVAVPLWEDSPFVDPRAVVSVAAFVAIGNTSTEDSTYTQSVLALASPLSISLKVPAGAAKWRVTGFPEASSTLSPFQANVVFSPSFAGLALESYDGADLEAPMVAGDWIPLIGAADKLTIANGGATTLRFNIMWGLDL